VPSTSLALFGPPAVITQTMSNTLIAPNTVMQAMSKVVSRTPGTVTYQNCRMRPAPSRAAAS
jgi:hypothetical protein